MVSGETSRVAGLITGWALPTTNHRKPKPPEIECWAMKSLFLCIVSFIVVASLKCDARQSNALASDCSSSPRIVGAFGAMDKPIPAVSGSDAIRTQLPDVKTIRAARETTLAPSGEQVIMYDTTTDELAPQQKVAVITNGRLIATFDVPRLVAMGEQAMYQASCQFEIEKGRNGFIIAYVLSGDGTGSAFVLLTHTPSGYRVVFARTVGQGRLVFQTGKFELWERSFDKKRMDVEADNFECEWCDHRYVITKYVWSNGSYIKTLSKKTKTSFDPAEITGTPIVILGRGVDTKK